MTDTTSFKQHVVTRGITILHHIKDEEFTLPWTPIEALLEDIQEGIEVFKKNRRGKQPTTIGFTKEVIEAIEDNRLEIITKKFGLEVQIIDDDIIDEITISPESSFCLS